MEKHSYARACIKIDLVACPAQIEYHNCPITSGLDPSDKEVEKNQNSGKILKFLKISYFVSIKYSKKFKIWPALVDSYFAND